MTHSFNNPIIFAGRRFRSTVIYFGDRDRQINKMFDRMMIGFIERLVRWAER